MTMIQRQEESMSPNRHTRRRLAALAALGAAATAALAAGPAANAQHASPARASAKGGICAGFAVTVDGRTFKGDQRRTIKGPISSIQVRGTYIEFDVVPTSFEVDDYLHTGKASPRPDKNLPFNGRTPIYTSKLPGHGKTLGGALSLELRSEALVLQRAGSGQTMKIQAKDCHQGGIFQLENEPGTTQTNTLAAGWHYTSQPPGQTRLCITNGKISAYDSPEAATLVSHTATTAVWRVAAGGRIGFVIGEDAVQGGCRP
jgi:hypothetical protein